MNYSDVYLLMASSKAVFIFVTAPSFFFYFIKIPNLFHMYLFVSPTISTSDHHDDYVLS